MAAPAVTSEPGEAAADGTPRHRRPPLPVLLRSLLAVGAGSLLYLAAPPRPAWWLAPVGFAVLWLVVHGRTRARAGFGYAFLTGLGYFTPLLAWTGEFVGPVAWLPLSIAEAFLVGLAGAAIALTAATPGGPLVAALLWMAGEWLRDVFPFGGFPWGKIAFGQPEGAYLPLAAVGGTPLVGFAVVLTGFGAGEVLRRLIAGRERRASRMILPVLATVLPIAAGFAASPLVNTAAEAGEVTVAAIQGNVPRAGLDFNAQRRAVLDNHVRRTEQVAEEVRSGRLPKPDLVIWPENSSDIDPYQNADAAAAIDTAARAIAALVLVRVTPLRAAAAAASTFLDHRCTSYLSP